MNGFLMHTVRGDAEGGLAFRYRFTLQPVLPPSLRAIGIGAAGSGAITLGRDSATAAHATGIFNKKVSRRLFSLHPVDGAPPQIELLGSSAQLRVLREGQDLHASTTQRVDLLAGDLLRVLVEDEVIAAWRLEEAEAVAAAPMPDTEASEEDKVAAIAAAPVPVPDAEVGEEAEAAAGPENVSDDASYVSLRAMLGERPSEALLRTLLAEAGGDVSTAANTFFDAGEHGRIPSAKRQCTLSAFFGGRRESATSSAAAVAPAPPLASPERKRGSAPIDLTGASPSSLPMAAAPSPARDLTPAVAAPATHGPSALPPPPSEAEPPPTCRAELTEALHLYSPGAAGWPSAAPVPYSHIAAALDAVSATRSRLTKELVLTNFFRKPS